MNLILPIGFLIVCLFLVVLPIFETPQLVGVDVALLVAGIPVYLFFIKWKSKPRWLKKIFREFISINGSNEILHSSQNLDLIWWAHIAEWSKALL